MNFYTLAAKLRRDIARQADHLETLGYDESTAGEIAKSSAMTTFEANTRLGIELMLKYKEIASEMGLIQDKVYNTFMITIRPECKKVSFEKFYDDVYDYLERKMFCGKHIYAVRFEQKGTSDETLGHGFHVHIISETNCRSKGEVLRNTISTFKNYCAANCIQVDLCKNPEETKQKYLIDYESKDGHKIVTKEWDDKWRASWQNIFDKKREEYHKSASPIKSDEGPRIIMLE